jgi:methyl-accepting chemotaxis protein
MTPRGAIRLFVPALLGAAGLLWYVPVVFAPALVVGVYGVILFLLQLRKSGEVNSTVKDSPYFLGFILTLLGLLKIFWDIGADSAAGKQIDIPHLVAQAGGAILATIVGLFLRQVLWSHDKGEDERDKVFEQLSQSLKDSAVDYKQQQGELVALIQDFVKSRKRLLATEEAVHARYVSHLEQTSDVLDRFNADYPAKMALLLQSLVDSGTTISKAAETLGAVVNRSGEDLANTYANQSRVFVDAVTTVSAPIGQAGTKLSQTVASFETVLGDGSQKIADALNRFATTIGETPASLTATAQSLQSLRDRARDLDDAVNTVIRSATSIQHSIASLVEGLTADTISIHADIHKRSEILKDDITEVDRAFDDLMRLMRERILAGDARLNTRA